MFFHSYINTAIYKRSSKFDYRFFNYFDTYRLVDPLREQSRLWFSYWGAFELVVYTYLQRCTTCRSVFCSLITRDFDVFSPIKKHRNNMTKTDTSHVPQLLGQKQQNYRVTLARKITKTETTRKSVCPRRELTWVILAWNYVTFLCISYSWL